MKYQFLLFILALAGQLVYSQTASCDGNRYRADVFSQIDSTMAVKFGENTTFEGDFQELFMDIYEPADDELAQRPVIILAFGGSFVDGSRGDLAELCRRFARRGFVAATIDYRLVSTLFTITEPEQSIDVTIKAASDVKAAIRFFREDADTDDTYRINPNQLFVGGVSAGAIAAAHAILADSTDELDDTFRMVVANNGGFQGNSSDNTSYSSEANGFINYSGAILNASWIDANDPPIISVHDEEDPVVPYGSATVPVSLAVAVLLEGSQSITQAAADVMIPNELVTVPNSQGHVSYFLEQEIIDSDSIIDVTARFFGELICGALVSVEEDLHQTVISVYPNPFAEKLVISQPLSNNLPYQVTLHDLTGKILLNEKINPGQDIAWNVRKLPAGVYIVRYHSSLLPNFTGSVKVVKTE